MRLTLLTSLARAFVLNRPTDCERANKSTALHASTEELDAVRHLPQKVKGKGRLKDVPDEARELLEQKLVAGNAMLRRV